MRVEKYHFGYVVCANNGEARSKAFKTPEEAFNFLVKVMSMKTLAPGLAVNFTEFTHRREIHFYLVSNEPVTPEMAKDAQAKCGFLPMGYGFDAYETGDYDGVLYWARWHCSSSCE